jgi:hypothetical protein
MRCEHYWREGVEMVERGEPDPHRAGCADCRTAHAARCELVDVLPLIGARGRDDDQWQAGVWNQIARDRSRRQAWRCAGGALAAAVATTVFWLAIDRGREQPAPLADAPAVRIDRDAAVAPPDAPKKLAQIEIISGPVAMRSTSARVGDRVRISARTGDEVRVYRDDRLMLRCSAAISAAGCIRGPAGVVGEATLATAGPYQLVVIEAASLPAEVLEPTGSLSKDLAALVPVDGLYQLTDLYVR